MGLPKIFEMHLVILNSNQDCYRLRVNRLGPGKTTVQFSFMPISPQMSPTLSRWQNEIRQSKEPFQNNHVRFEDRLFPSDSICVQATCCCLDILNGRKKEMVLKGCSNVDKHETYISCCVASCRT